MRPFQVDGYICIKLADFIKGIDKILGDASLVTLDDTTASIRFNKFMLQFKTKLKLFGEIEWAIPI